MQAIAKPIDYSSVGETIKSARTEFQTENFEVAASLYSAAIEDVKEYMKVPKMTSEERARLCEVLSMLNAELNQLRIEQSVYKTAMAQMSAAASDLPPADPSVEPPPVRPAPSAFGNPARRPVARPPITTGRLNSTSGRAVDNDPSRKTSANPHDPRAVRRSSSQQNLPVQNKKAAVRPKHMSASSAAEANQTNETQQPAQPQSEEPRFDMPGYEQSLISCVEQMMVRIGEENQVKFADVAGLEQAKQTFRDAIILPSLMPDFFKGIRRACRAVLMVGPPGTGKTMLARAVATECNTTFFSVNCADISSKWRGDSEKIVKILFQMARFYSPSTIFIDEIDTIGSQRATANEHEASRRVKSQLLTEMDGFATEAAEKRVLVIAATNFPWALDEALRRRFELRIYIPLPCQDARLALIRNAFKDLKLEEGLDLDAIAQSLEGYSGCDINVICRKAAMAGMRRLSRQYTPAEILALPQEELDKPVTLGDFEEAIADTKASVAQDNILQFDEWMKQYGST